nr:DUF5319 family protein [Corynebacterium pseudotuberculosis]
MVKHVNFDWQMPRDPFADDPNDPASFLDEDEPLPPLSEAEKRHIEEDLRLVQRFKKVLQPRVASTEFSSSAKTATRNTITTGTSMMENIRATLNGELSPVHEPSLNPNPQAYVPWDYCLGYLDGLEAPRFF